MVLSSCIKGFLRAKKLWVNPPKAERAKPSLSSDYNLLFKNKIGERSLDIHRWLPNEGSFSYAIKRSMHSSFMPLARHVEMNSRRSAAFSV